MKEVKKNSKTAAPSIMEELLEKTGKSVILPKVGESMEGTVFDIGSNAVYVDLDQFGAGVIRGEELQAGSVSSKDFKIGDKVTAIVEDLNNEENMIELSFKQASLEKAWEDILNKKQSKEVISAKILFANKGGLLVEINGIPGFLPVSQLAPEHYPKVEDSDKNKILSRLRDFIGKNISARIIDADPESKKLIISEKAIQDEEKKSLLSEFQVGDIIEGIVSGVVDFGAFIKFAPRSEDIEKIEEDKKLEGLVHISELAWQLIENPRNVIKEGDRVKAKIISIEGGSRVSLSIKNLSEDPWKKIGDKYKPGQKVKGTVSKINHFGAFVDIDEEIHGLVHASGLPRQKEEIETEKSYDFEIVSIEPETHKMGLKIWKEKESGQTADSASNSDAASKEKNKKSGSRKIGKSAEKSEQGNKEEKKKEE